MFFQFILLILFIVNLESSINLGLIESDSDLINICQIALNEAKRAGKCATDEIKLGENFKKKF
jgi:hypothetical protein